MLVFILSTSHELFFGHSNLEAPAVVSIFEGRKKFEGKKTEGEGAFWNVQLHWIVGNIAMGIHDSTI